MTQFDSPLVRELYEIAEEVLIPRIKDLHGFPGGMIKGFVLPLLPQLPQAFAVLDRDPNLQRAIMEQLEQRYHRLKPQMEEYLRQSQQIDDLLQGESADAAQDQAQDSTTANP